MNYCTSCGSEIPDGQGKCCSMCYGDISYGRDGYYHWIAEQEQERWNKEQEDRVRQIVASIFYHRRDEGKQGTSYMVYYITEMIKVFVDKEETDKLVKEEYDKIFYKE